VSNKSNKSPERRAWRTDEEWARLRERVTASDPAAPAAPVLGWRVPMVAAAAVAVLAVGAGVSWPVWRMRSRLVATPPMTRVATTGVGERLTIHLADSSVVTVGPVSTIRYSASATGRSVAVVDGIADFNIVHDATRPFRVRAKNAVVTDVGTEFVVRAYAADSGVDVSVTSGVALVSGGASDSIELRAGQVAFVTANGRAAKVTGMSAQTLAAWIHGQLVFDDVPLSTVAAELDRWFDVQIRVPDQQLARRRLSAVYNRPTLSGVLDAITATLRVRYHRAGNVVTILPAKP
jgi:transmembrane sensor